jgi:hypothetical protein
MVVTERSWIARRLVARRARWLVVVVRTFMTGNGVVV